MSDLLTLQERIERYHARNEMYRQLGYDNPATTAFVVDISGPIIGPVLDVGTGKGALALELARRGVEVVSIDIDPEEQTLARHLAVEEGLEGRIEFMEGDAGDLPFSDGHFGWVGMIDVLHHLAEADPVLDEMVRVVRTGGALMVSDFSEPGFAVIDRVHQEEGRVHERSASTVESATARLIAAGCEPVLSAEEYLHLVSVLRRVS